MNRMLLAGMIGVATITLATAAGAQTDLWKNQPAAQPKTDALADTKPATTTSDTPAPGTTDQPAATSSDTPDPATAAPDAGAPAATPPKGAEPVAAEANPAPEDPAAALAKDPKYMRALKPIVDQINLAVKQLNLFDKEMAKPEKERKASVAAGYKLRAAQAYNLATMKAKAAESQFSKAEDKQPIIDLYEKPCREKAVAIYLELADEAKQLNDMRTAVTLYQDILKLDPTNVAAKDALTAIEEAAKAAAAANNNANQPRGVGGGTTAPHQWETWKQPHY